MESLSPFADTRPRVALIAGPTASGKSGLAVALAQSVNAAGRDAIIINADASQVYADIPILSARPTVTEMAGIPHRLFGHVDGVHDYNAARWAEEARAEIAAAHQMSAIPIVVGGSGMHIATLLSGIAPIPEIPDQIRADIRALPVAEAYRRLQLADRHAADRLNPPDKTRIARALEVVTATGTPIHIWQERREGGIIDHIDLVPQILLPPRTELRDRCDARLQAMFAGGAIAEVEALLERQLSPDLPVMRAIGVPEISRWLSGEFAHHGHGIALELAQRATRQYAKRQYTWFRNQFPLTWPRVTESLNHIEIDNLVIKLRNMILTT